MGTITVTNTQVDSGDIRIEKLITYAGGTQTDIDNALYDYAAESLTVPAISNIDLANALSGYDASFEAAEIANIRKEEKVKIDAAAGAKRDEYITVAPGQEMTYIRKAEDAQRYIDDAYPADATPYPWVNAEAVSTGYTPTQIADNIKAQNDAWIAVGTAIEGIRIGAKVAVDNATTIATVKSISATSIADIGAL